MTAAQFWQQVGALVTSFLRSALAAAIALILANQMSVTHMTGDQWLLVADAAIAGGLVTVYVFLDPNDKRFGLGSLAAVPATTEETVLTEGET